MPPASNRLLIVPAHGGDDPGCIGNGIVEKDFTLMMGEKLFQALYHLGLKNLEVSLGRADDREFSLSRRRQMEIDLKANMVLELHVDVSEDKNAYGLAAYYWPSNTETLSVATSICDASPYTMRTATPAQPEYYPYAYNCVRNYASDTVLVECGFVSNEIEAKALQKPLYQDEIIAQILNGICHWRALRGQP